MAYPVSLAELQARVLQRSNLEGAAAFITTQELTGCINGSVADWYDLVRLTTWGGQYYRAPFTVTTSAQTPTYALPQDFLSLLSVDCYLSPTWKVKGRPYQEEDSAMFTGPNIPVGWTTRTPIFYQLQQGNIAFLPIPSGTYSVILNYVKTAPQFGQPEDTLDSINSWDEFIVLDAAAKILLKDGQLEMRSAIIQEREGQRARIEAVAAQRDQGGAEVVHDVTSYSGWDVGGFY